MTRNWIKIKKDFRRYQSNRKSGKMFVFKYKWRKKWRFSYRPRARALPCQRGFDALCCLQEEPNDIVARLIDLSGESVDRFIGGVG